MKSKRRLKPLLLLGLTILGTLGMAEIILRTTVDPARVWRNAWFIPILSERYYQEKFRTYYNNANRPPPDQMEAVIGWNRELGWDNAAEGGIRPPARPDLSKGKDFRIIFIGDSFAWANEVPDDQAFHYLLGQHPGIEAFSMGTSGYGIDQAVMKYDGRVRAYKPDLLVLVVHPPDYERSTLTFISAAKPRYHLTAKGELAIENRPVPTVDEQIKTIDRRHRWWPWSLGFLVSNGVLIPGLRDALEQAWLEKWDRVMEAALTYLRNRVTEDGGDILIIQIPAGHAYVSRPGIWNDLNEARNLRGIYDRLGLAWFDLAEEWPKDIPAEEIGDAMYTKLRDGSYGHLNEAGNRHLATILSDMLCGRRSSHGTLRRLPACIRN